MKSMHSQNQKSFQRRGAHTSVCHVSLWCLALGALLLGSACTHAQTAGRGLPMSVTVTNPSGLNLTDAVVRIEHPFVLDAINANKQETLTAIYEGVPVATQKLDHDGDGEVDEFLILDNIGANQSRTYLLQSAGIATPKFAQRAQAEISVKEGGQWTDGTNSSGMPQKVYRGGTFKNVQHLDVPAEHTDHSFYIRYEGPGWESDLVGYRIYLDWRNAIDIFGKKTKKMVLQDVGQDGFDSYHEDAEWGLDILKVGNALGIGGFGYWDGSKANRVAETGSLSSTIHGSGPITACFNIVYDDWKIANKTVDLTADFSIDAGSRLTKQVLTLSEPLDNLCTGIVKHPGTEVIMDPAHENGWTYIGTWGKQTLEDPVKDLGMAIFYRTEDLISRTEDPINSVVLVLKPTGNKVTYYYAAAWAGEPGGITTRDGFVEYMKETAARLNTSLKVDIGGSN